MDNFDGGVLFESEFEKLRRENMKANAEMFKQLFPDGILQQSKPVSTSARRRNRKTCRELSAVRHSTRRAVKRKRFYASDEEPSDNCETAPMVRFSWNTRKRKSLIDQRKFNLDFLKDCADTFAEDDLEPVRKRLVYDLRPFDAVKEEDLVLVAERTSDKQYNSIDGTSCHQCRQKTDDLKTVCRSGECVGIRGQFCGPCLKNRYGECAKEAIMDPSWTCPPCRGVCNCSFCMKKRGRRATGILIHVAKKNGFENVKSFLGD